ncbi:MAG: hypothetical protein ICV79_01310, partial [Flavisolibacter sp.]|nr:hypothetical protein [Flavisolibacter sp.]
MKKLTALLIASFSALLFFPSILSAQNLDGTLSQYATKYQPEKAYLQYDKAAYYPGEIVWFKVYLIEGLFPVSGSKTFYVDWIGTNGQVLYHTVSPIVDGTTNGQFEIPTNYTGDFIHVRAYTTWMLNFDTAFLYSKNIHILSKNTSAATASKSAPVPSLQFFPEGGDLISGIDNKIAFKAADQWGRPLSVSGTIVDAKGTVVTSFQSVHDGMGSFYISPQAGVVYSARWKADKGTERTTALPQPKPTGITMQVNGTAAKRFIDLRSTDPLPEQLKNLHLLGTMNGNKVFQTDVVMKPKDYVRRVIPVEQLPSGTLTITVFDADWNAIAERISFINNHDYEFQTNFNVQHWGLNKRARNEIQITIPDSLQQASLSISVTDAAIERDSSNNIISHLLLTSDIKGRVYHPAYYFSNTTDSVAQHLDLVMLTNGWRRFRWEDVTKGKLPIISYPKDTTYLNLSGQVYGVAKNQLSGNENIILIVKGKDSAARMLLVPIQPNGTFSDPSVVLFDTLQVYYQLKSKLFSSAEARFMTSRMPAPDYTAMVKSFVLPTPYYDTSGTAYHSFLAAETMRLQALQKSKMMENITITTKAKPPIEVLNEKYTSPLFRTGDAYQFDLVNDPMAASQMSIFSYLQGRVPGLQITGSPASPSLSWRGGAPQLFLDEIPADAELLNMIPITDVAYIKVMRPPFFGATGGGGNGAIAIYTRKGSDRQNRPGRGLASNTVIGYTPIRQFYAPDYDRTDPRNEEQDMRTTLYWNPQVNITPKNKTIRLRFYNNDVTKAFRVVIEGMS